jgi:Anti-sigma-K factor rskA/Putative zinc-finger
MPGRREMPAGRLRAAADAARMRHADPHTLLGAYVMDAVTDADRARFDQHLVNCETCRAEVRGLREATARLAAAAAIRPRDGLREQTMQAAGLIRQLPPVTGEAAPGRAGQGPAARWWAARWWAARPALARIAGAGRPRAWLPRLAVLVVAALAVVAVSLGAAMHGAEHRLDMAQRRTHDLAAVLAAPDATMLTASVTSGGSATVVMSHRARALVFTAAGLPVLPSSSSYELWLAGPDGMRPAGTLPLPHNGMTGPMVIAGLEPGDRVGLTVEPASGAARPTSRQIMMLTLGT